MEIPNLTSYGLPDIGGETLRKFLLLHIPNALYCTTSMINIYFSFHRARKQIESD